MEVRIRLSGTHPKVLDELCGQVKTIATRTGVDCKGPVPLPTKRLVVPVRKSPDGEGSATWDHWEMRVHKRLLILEADQRALQHIKRLQIPKEVNIEIAVR